MEIIVILGLALLLLIFDGKPHHPTVQPPRLTTDVIEGEFTLISDKRAEVAEVFPVNNQPE